MNSIVNKDIMKKEDLYDRVTHNLDYLLKKMNVTIKDLAAFTEIPASTIYAIMNKTTTEPRLHTIVSIAKFFNINVSQLIGEIPFNYPNINIPILPWSAINNNTGNVELNINTNTQYISTNYKTSNPIFAFQFDASIAYQYKDGGILILEITKNFLSNDIIVVCIKNTQAILKKVIQEGPSIYLESISHNIPAIEFDATMQIVGIVREVRLSS